MHTHIGGLGSESSDGPPTGKSCSVFVSCVACEAVREFSGISLISALIRVSVPSLDYVLCLP